MDFKFEIGDIVKVDMSPKLKAFANHPKFAKDQGLVKIIDRKETSHEPEYEIEPYPLPDDHPDDYRRSLYQKFLKNVPGRKVLHAFEHKGVHLLVWIENDELHWAHQTLDDSEWRDWGGAFLPTRVNKELNQLWEETK